MTRITTWIAASAAAALVLAGCGGDDGGSAAAVDGSLVIEAGDMYFEPDQLSAEPGEVTFTLENEGGVVHDLLIEELGDEVIIGEVAPGRSETRSVTLEEGTYTLYCDVPGHRESGMTATLEVG